MTSNNDENHEEFQKDRVIQLQQCIADSIPNCACVLRNVNLRARDLANIKAMGNPQIKSNKRSHEDAFTAVEADALVVRQAHESKARNVRKTLGFDMICLQNLVGQLIGDRKECFDRNCPKGIHLEVGKVSKKQFENDLPEGPTY